MRSDTVAAEITILPLFQRIEKLERDNRNLKRVISILCVLFIAAFTMAQLRPAPKVIEAERFVVKDSSGKEKASLGTETVGPERLVVTSLTIQDYDAKHQALTVISPASISLDNRIGERHYEATFSSLQGQSFRSSENGDEQELNMSLNGPTIKLADKQGFQTIIGATDLQTVKTGETHRTSAASILIFDKEKNVIWKAPVR
jgi:hypothetical protein